MVVNDNDTVLVVKNLEKSYDKHQVLHNISFSINRGEFVSLIGSSGCGKTTLIKCLNCLEIPDVGEIICEDLNLSFNKTKQKQINFLSNNPLKDAQKKDAAEYFEPEMKKKIFNLRQKVGFMFQEMNLFPHLTVLKNITLALEKVKLMTQEESENIAMQMLQKVGLTKYTERYPHQLSAGQQQRTAVARALAMNPAIMLYDEPTSSLDPKLVVEVIAIIKDLTLEGMTQLVVTHSLQVAKNSSHRVIFMEKGNIIEIDTPSVIFNNPKDSRTKEYISILE